MHNRIVIFAGILLMLASCSHSKLIKIESTNFSEEVSENQELVFTFNQSAVSDSLLNIWDTTQYLRFTPQVPGRYRWIASNQLEFSPAVSYRPSTDYTVQATPLLSLHADKKYEADDAVISFHTPYLNLTTAKIFWATAADDVEKIEVRILVDFNYPVVAAEVEKLLHIINTTTNNVVPFKLLNFETDNQLELAIDAPDVSLSETVPLKITVDKGLKCMKSEWVSKAPMEYITQIPSRDQLLVSEITTAFVDAESYINILTTQPIKAKGIEEFITINPVVSYTVSILPNGIQLKGDFSENVNYQVSLSEKLSSVFGVALGKEYSQYISFGKPEPYIAFENKQGVYLSSKGNRNIAVNIINVPKIKIRVFKIYENNIIQYLRGKNYYRENYSYNSYYEDNEYGDDYYEEEYYYDDYGYGNNYYMDDNYGDEIYSKEIETKTLPKNGKKCLLNLKLDEIAYSDNYKGLYLVRIESSEKSWKQASQLVSVSDIGLIVKKAKNDLLVFVNSIVNAEPLPNINVTLISSNNQKIESATTNRDGVARFSTTPDKLKNFRIAMITARQGEDFNYLMLSNSRVETSRYDVGGKRTNEGNYDAFIYGERNLYRPGDSIYFNTIIRTPDWQTLSDAPIKIQILYPNGKEYLNFKKNLNNEGAVETRFVVPTTAITGIYNLNVYSGNDVFLNSTQFKVEEFMPDRIKVNVELDKKEYKTGDKVLAKINAMNLFGPPAANRNYEAELSVHRKDFRSKKYRNYNFSISTSKKFRFENDVRESKTDAEGNAEEEFTFEDYKNIGILNGTLYTTVFDETGRPVNRITDFDYYTQSVFLGIHDMEYWIGTRQPKKVNFIALNKDGSLMNNVPAKVQIVRYYYESVLEKRSGGYGYYSQKREQIVMNKEMTISGETTSIDFTPIHSGDYEIRIYHKGDDNYVGQSLYAYGWGDTEYSSFAVSNEGEVDIQFDKEKYEVGDHANILFSTPFAGKLLVTVERENIIDYYYLETDKKAASLKLAIKDMHLPNVYITATAIRGMKDNSIPLTIARGFAPLLIEKPSNKINVQIEVAKNSRSKTKQNIKIKATPNTELTIAVVDEGILQLTDYKTPDPFGYFYQKRALEVDAYDLYPFLFPELASSSSSYGGDGGYDLNKRVNPLTNKRVNLVAFWSGIIKTNSQGECNFPVNIPQFSGSLRIMAAAYQKNKFGSAEASMKVADPVVISTALPRFISPGDTVIMPITISNTTAKTATAKVNVKAGNSNLKVVGSDNNSVTINANAETQAVFKLVAAPSIGETKVQVSVTAMNETFSDETNITVRPPSGLIKISDAGSIKAGETKKLNVHSGFIPTSTASKLVISRMPVAQFSKNIAELVRYPYGCAEQTISAAFPQIYFADLAKALGQEKNPTRYNPEYNVREALKKISGMQQYNGGITLWDDGNNDNWWASAYAAHFFYEAKKAGYEVKPDVFNNLLNYLSVKIKNKSTQEYWYYDKDDKLQKKIIASQELFYSIYVLALTGKADIASMNYYKSNLSLLSQDCKYLLAASYALLGDQASYNSIAPKEFGDTKAVRAFGGSFYSYIRDLSISLYTLLEVDPNSPQVGIMVKHLSEQMKKSSWMSTQENSFAILALGKFAQKAAATNASATVTIGGKIAGTLSSKDLIITQNIDNQSVNISTTGSGNIYYFYEVEGISATVENIKEEDSYLKVRKTFYDRFGHELTGNNFEQNDLVVLKVSVNSGQSGNIDNVVVSDLLPACFEIENPRLSGEREMDWIKDQSSPDYLDIRDDRINFMGPVYNTTKNYYYMVRVVSKGTYQMGPVSADAMYNGEYHSNSGARRIVVK